MKKNLYLMAFAVGLSASAHAASVINFSFTSDATPIITSAPLTGTLSVDYAYLETLDEQGDPLLHPSFRPDISAGSIVVGNPSLSGYGAPIAGNALNALDSPVLLSFSNAQDIGAFGVTLDNSTLGTLFGTFVEFYDANDILISSISVDQTVPGFAVADLSVYSNVSKIVLPSGAFYDNLSFTANTAAVPEPGRATLLGFGLAMAFLRRRRK
ncbi:MAG: hypothetical protein RL693_1211 [Verrucomicrobiota bacterium]|jgi:hypothetical protein